MAATATTAALQLASRSIHIKIRPTAHIFSERREIIRVLERFGSVEMFRSLKYDTTSPVQNTFLSVLNTEEAARAAIAASPIRYRLLDGADANASQDTTSKSSIASTEGETETPPDLSKSPTAAPVKPRVFEIHISHSTHPHHLQVSSSLLWGPYSPIDPRLSAIAADLSSRIPASIAKPGLVDWVTGAGVGGVVHQDSKPWRLTRKEKESKERQTPTVMKGLVAFRERNAARWTEETTNGRVQREGE